MLLSLNIALIPFLLWRAWMYSPDLIRGIPHFSWSFNGDGIRFKPAFWRWLFGDRLGNLILGIWGMGIFLVGLIDFRKKTILTFTFLAGAFLYLSVFATANVRHDYYQIFIMPAVALVLAQGVVFVFSQLKTNKVITFMVVTFSIAMMLGLGWFRVRDNYQINNPAIISAGEAVDAMTPKDALVIAPYNGDTAFLYQTKRWGWPVITEDIKDMIIKGADYYVSVDLGSQDSVNFKKRFETVKEETNFIILDLNKPLEQ